MSQQFCATQLELANKELQFGMTSEEIKALSGKISDALLSGKSPAVVKRMLNEVFENDLNPTLSQKSWERFTTLEKSEQSINHAKTLAKLAQDELIRRGKGTPKLDDNGKPVLNADGTPAMVVSGVDWAKLHEDVVARINSTDMKAHAIVAEAMGPLEQFLKNNRAKVEVGVLDLDTVRELHAIEHGLGRATNNEFAQQYADLITEARKRIEANHRAVNPFYKTIPNFLFNGSHSREKVGAVSFEEWFKFAKDAYWDNSFKKLGDHNDPDVAAKKVQIFKDIYERIKLGIYGTEHDESRLPKTILEKIGRSGINDVGEGGLPRNVMAKLAKHRELLFADPVKAYEYMARFGEGSLYESVAKSIHSQAKIISILDSRGSNVDMHAKLLDSAILGMITDPQERALFQSQYGKDRRALAYRVSLNSVDAPATNLLGNITSGLMSVKHMATTGLSALSSVPDIANVVSRAQLLTGTTFGDAMVGVHSTLLKVLSASPEEKSAMLRAAFMIGEVAVKSNRAKYGVGPGSNLGKGSKVSNWLGKRASQFTMLTGQNLQTETIHLTMAGYTAERLAALVRAGYDNMESVIPKDLVERTKRNLLENKIGPAEFELYKHMIENIPDAEADKLGGIGLVTPERVDKLSDDVVIKYLLDSGKLSERQLEMLRAGHEMLNMTKKNMSEIDPKDMPGFGLTGDEGLRARIDREKMSIKAEYGAFLNSHAMATSSTPGALTRAKMFDGHSINTPSGAVWHLLMQLKSASVQAYVNYKWTLAHGGDTISGGIAPVLGLAVNTMMYAGIGELLKQMVKGQKPDPTSKEFLLKIIAASGLGSIFGDMVMNELSKDSTMNTAARLVTSMAGPGIGTIAELGSIPIDVAKSYISEDVRGGERWKMDLAGVLTRNVPYQNHWLFGALFNFYLANALKNTIDPEFGSRLEEKHEAGYYMFKPSKAGETLNPFE